MWGDTITSGKTEAIVWSWKAVPGPGRSLPAERRRASWSTFMVGC
jgi:hypothetical protein